MLEYLNGLRCLPINNSNYNYTEFDEPDPAFEDDTIETNVRYIVFIPIYLLTFVVGSVGNSLVIFLILKVKKLHSITSMFLMSLAVADLLLIVICVPIKVTEFFTNSWVLPSFMCKVFHYLHTFTAICSVMNLTVMSLGKFN